MAVLRLMISSTLVDLLDRQFGWLVALESTSGVDASQTARIRNTTAVANQAAGRHELAKLVDRRHQMADRLCRFGVAIEDRVSAY